MVAIVTSYVCVRMREKAWSALLTMIRLGTNFSVVPILSGSDSEKLVYAIILDFP